MKKRGKPALFYLSESLISLVCGFLFGLFGMNIFDDSPELWLVCSALGAYMGRKTLNLLCRIILGRINASVEKLEDIDLDEQIPINNDKTKTKDENG
ncbi:hypothetical protein V6O07_03240 [Arthrospira platensis SPKY2]